MGEKAVINIIANIIGALGAIVFVGFFAYKVDKLPLTIIVVVCLGLMVYSFYDDVRNDRTIAQFHSKTRASNSAGSTAVVVNPLDAQPAGVRPARRRIPTTSAPCATAGRHCRAGRRVARRSACRWRRAAAAA